MVADSTFVVRIPAAMYQDMLVHVAAGYPNETCGLLASKDGQIVKNYPTANAAEYPDDFSEISPEDLLHISYDIDDYDGRDIEWAKRNQLYYIIFSHRLYPEPPYVRVFSIQEDDTVIEGKVEIV